MKQKLKYILPILVILVLLWGLLEFAEKAALLVSITVLTSYILYQYREDRNLRRQAMMGGFAMSEDAELVQIAPLEVSFEEQAKASLTELLRISLKLNQGRFKQEVEELNRRANRMVESLEKETLAPQDCPDLCQRLDEVTGLIKRSLSLQEDVKTNPAAHDEMHEIQARIRKVGEHLRESPV